MNARSTDTASRPALAALAAVAGIAGACGAMDGTAPASSSIAPTWEAVVEARIGSLDDEEQSLTNVGQVLIGAGGELLITQPWDGDIRVHGADGSLLRRIGRKGEGPGEFAQLMYAVIQRDTLFAGDVGRISAFSPDGHFIRSEPLTAAEIRSDSVTWVPSAPLAFVRVPDGSAVVRPGMFMRARPPTENGFSVLRLPWLRIDEHSIVTDTLLWEELRSASVRITREGQAFNFTSPFNDSRLFALMPDGTGALIVDRPSASSAGSAAFIVTLIDLNGDTVFSRSHDYNPVQVTDALLRLAVAGVSGHPADHPALPTHEDVERELRDRELVPAFLAPVSAVATGSDGSIWLRREAVSADSVTWEVLDPTGTRQGTVRLPPEQRVVAAHGDVMATLEYDSFDVPYVVRYRLQR